MSSGGAKRNALLASSSSISTSSSEAITAKLPLYANEATKLPVEEATTDPVTKPPALESLPPPDGHFNSIPVYYKSEPVHSTYNCIGENFRDDAWLFRSCTFRNLCFDMSNNSFVLFPSPEDQAFAKLVQQDNTSNFTYLSTTGEPLVSLGGINPKWKGFHKRSKLKWFPRLETKPLETGYYELPPDSVWLPFHSFAGYNAGHLFWDDFFPIFKLLSIFDLLSFRLVLTKMEVKLWATCDWNPKNTETCKRTFAKFLPAMGLTNETFSAAHDFRFNLSDDSPSTTPKSKYICSPRGTAGLGMLTDHGLKAHGWDSEDFETTHNVGQGQAFYNYRNFMLRNLGLPTERKAGPPYSLVFSRFSSSTKGRVKGFGMQEKMLKANFSSDLLDVSGYRMSSKTLIEQAEVASQAAIFITCVGGGAMTATFLPRGSTLILFYEATGGTKRNKDTGKPAPLDWDVLNHAAHLRVHWLPVETLDEPHDMRVFEELIRHELRILAQL
jgi:hypothetical protein